MRTLSANNLILVENQKSTYISADAAAGASSITVESIIGFSTNYILLIGEVGAEASEIIKTHAATSPTGTTITLASNLASAHSIGTKVYIIEYDQLEVSHATTSTGSKSVLATIALQPDSSLTLYTDSTKSSGYYFLRFKDTINTLYSDYSDPIPFGGYAENQVGSVIQWALNHNKTSYTQEITHDFCIKEINDCLTYIRGKLKKWHRNQSFDYVLGTTAQGEWKFSLPATMWTYSPKSVYAVRLFGQEQMTWMDERDWDEMLEGVYYTTLSAQATSGSTTITLTDSSSFLSSGTIMIDGQEITYTANDTSTGILSGIPASGTGSITATCAAGLMVWQGSYDEGIPSAYTIKGGYFYHWPLIDSDHEGEKIILDYWLEAPSVDSDGDTLDILRYDMAKYWLTWKIRSSLKNDGILDYTDGDFKMFEQRLKDAIKEERTNGQKYKTSPKVNTISFRRS